MSAPSRRKLRSALALAACFGCASGGESGSAPLLAPMVSLEDTSDAAAPGERRAPRALAWVEDWSADPDAYVGALDELRAAQVATQEAVLASLGEGLALIGSEPGGGLAALRRRARADGHASVSVLRTRSRARVEPNALSPLFLLILPTPFVPGYHVEVRVVAELCGLDVAGGAVFACDQAVARGERRFVTPLRRRRHQRALRAEAVQQAASEAAAGHRTAVSRWLRGTPLLAPGPP